MKVSIMEKKDNLLDIEFDDKVLPNALLGVLMANKVDAYAYEPHPLIPGYRLHIEAKDPMKELNTAIKTVEADWKAFQKEFAAKYKPVRKEAKKPAAKKK
jgi:DNA-directed RNA polymerase subunit L